MTDATIQKKMDQLAALTRELTAEARARYGEDAQLFLEPELGFFLMDGDALGHFDHAKDRQSHIKFRSRGIALCDAGAWQSNNHKE